MAVTAALVAGSAIAAGGAIAGSAISAQGAKDAANTIANMPTSGYNPDADPVLNAISLESLLGLGRSDAGVAQQASPMAQVTAAALKLGLGNLSNEIGTAIASGTYNVSDNSADTAKGMAALDRALMAVGYSHPSELYRAQRAWEAQQAEMNARLAPVREAILKGRLSAYSGISKIAQDFPGASLADINALSKQYEDQIRSGIARDVADQRDQILQNANTLRGNPAATLGRLSQQELLSRQAAPTTALERAIQMLTARETLGTNAISAYQSVLDPANTLALNVANLRSTAATNAAQLMSGNNQFKTSGIASAQQAGANATASGVAGAGNALGGGISSLGNTLMLQSFLKNQSGGGPAAGSTTAPSNPFSDPNYLSSIGVS